MLLAEVEPAVEEDVPHVRLNVRLGTAGIAPSQPIEAVAEVESAHDLFLRSSAMSATSQVHNPSLPLAGIGVSKGRGSVRSQCH